MNGLHGKVALVTGASRGIGAAIATLFAAHGARAALHGRDVDALTEVQVGIERAGGRALQFTADVTRFAEIETMREEIEGELGPVDVLVANAGGSAARPAPLEDISEADWRAALDGNLTATFLTLNSVLPGMKQRGSGSIVTLSSAAARRASAGTLIAYATAKTGMELRTKDVAAQAGPYGVRANCVAPETILTERNRRQIPPAMQEQLVATHPLRRLGTPEDVARAALDLVQRWAAAEQRNSSELLADDFVGVGRSASS